MKWISLLFLIVSVITVNAYVIPKNSAWPYRYQPSFPGLKDSRNYNQLGEITKQSQQGNHSKKNLTKRS